MKTPLPDGGTLIRWGVWEMKKYLNGADCPFPDLMLRFLADTALRGGSAASFLSRAKMLSQAWETQPDLMLELMTVVREKVPLPCSRSKQGRIRAFLLRSRIMTVSKDEYSLNNQPDDPFPESPDIDLSIAESGQTVLAGEASKALGEKVTAAEISSNMKRLRKALSERGLLPRQTK
jgi:hypothetical protein